MLCNTPAAFFRLSGVAFRMSSPSDINRRVIDDFNGRVIPNVCAFLCGDKKPTIRRG